MKTIFNPNNKSLDRHICNCGCVFEANSDDYYKDKYGDETVYLVNCPCCGKPKEILRYKILERMKVN